jgi:hypothetical protein
LSHRERAATARASGNHIRCLATALLVVSQSTSRTEPLCPWGPVGTQGERGGDICVASSMALRAGPWSLCISLRNLAGRLARVLLGKHSVFGEGLASWASYGCGHLPCLYTCAHAPWHAHNRAHACIPVYPPTSMHACTNSLMHLQDCTLAHAHTRGHTCHTLFL